jgi:hypothetical protein
MIRRRGATAGLGALLLARRALVQEMPNPGKRDWARDIPEMRIGLLAERTTPTGWLESRRRTPPRETPHAQPFDYNPPVHALC